MKRFVSFGFLAVLLLSGIQAQAPCQEALWTPQGGAFHPGDLQVLEDIIAVNGLKTEPLKLGRQVWEDGRLAWFALGEDQVRIHRLPESFGCLTGLTHLFLSGNHLRQLPASIGQLHRLEALYLNDNALESLPESIGNLCLLEHLYLNNNLLTEIPQSLARLSRLRSLYLNDNQIRQIPPTLVSLPALRNLYF